MQQGSSSSAAEEVQLPMYNFAKADDKSTNWFFYLNAHHLAVFMKKQYRQILRMPNKGAPKVPASPMVHLDVNPYKTMHGVACALVSKKVAFAGPISIQYQVANPRIFNALLQLPIAWQMRVSFKKKQYFFPAVIVRETNSVVFVMDLNMDDDEGETKAKLSLTFPNGNAVCSDCTVDVLNVESIEETGLPHGISVYDCPLNELDASGFGLLHYAAFNDFSYLSTWLLLAGADINLLDAFGRTAREYADVLQFPKLQLLFDKFPDIPTPKLVIKKKKQTVAKPVIVTKEEDVEMPDAEPIVAAPKKNANKAPVAAIEDTVAEEEQPKPPKKKRGPKPKKKKDEDEADFEMKDAEDKPVVKKASKPRPKKVEMKSPEAIKGNMGKNVEIPKFASSSTAPVQPKPVVMQRAAFSIFDNKPMEFTTCRHKLSYDCASNLKEVHCPFCLDDASELASCPTHGILSAAKLRKQMQKTCPYDKCTQSLVYKCNDCKRYVPSAQLRAHERDRCM